MRRFNLSFIRLFVLIAIIVALCGPVAAVAAEASPALAAILQSSGLGWLIQYLVAAIAIASILDAVIPQPAAGSHWLPIRKLLSLAAANAGFAQNTGQPDIGTWIARVLKPLVDAQIARQTPLQDPVKASVPQGCAGVVIPPANGAISPVENPMAPAPPAPA